MVFNNDFSSIVGNTYHKVLAYTFFYHATAPSRISQVNLVTITSVGILIYYIRATTFLQS